MSGAAMSEQDRPAHRAHGGRRGWNEQRLREAPQFFSCARDVFSSVRRTHLELIHLLAARAEERDHQGDPLVRKRSTERDNEVLSDPTVDSRVARR